MNYTIFIREQVMERTKYVPGPRGSREIKPNFGPDPLYPAGAFLIYKPDTLDIYSSNPADRRVLLVDSNGTATGAEIFAAFPKIREPKALEIRAGGAKRLLALAAPYTAEERETWANQQKEAAEYLADPAAETPMIDAMAALRGISKPVLVGKIMENVNLFRTASGQILGEQQRLLDCVYAATEYDEMEAISW